MFFDLTAGRVIISDDDPDVEVLVDLMTSPSGYGTSEGGPRSDETSDEDTSGGDASGDDASGDDASGDDASGGDASGGDASTDPARGEDEVTAPR
jgi:hypothetical protein